MKTIHQAAALFLGTSILSLSAPGLAAPAVHWGSTTLNRSASACIGEAYGVLTTQEGLQNVRRTGSSVSGANGSVSVVVYCVPQTGNSSYLIVFASSDDSQAAANMRNDVRTKIINSREL